MKKNKKILRTILNIAMIATPILLITLIAIYIAPISKDRMNTNSFKLVKTMTVSDSDRTVQILEDTETGVQYIVDGNNWTVRSGGGIKPFSGR